MSRFPMFLACLAVLAFGLGLSGCNTPADAPSEQEVEGEQDPGHGEPGHVHSEGEAEHAEGEGDGEAAHEHGDAEEGSHSNDGAQVGSDIADALALLTESERAAAQQQKTCPVSGKLLGSMGKPCKVTVKGQDVFLCCQGCEGAITEDPDKYLAKLNQ